MRSRSASSELFATCKRQEGQRNRRVKEESYRKKSTGPSSRHINRQFVYLFYTVKYEKKKFNILCKSFFYYKFSWNYFISFSSISHSFVVRNCSYLMIDTAEKTSSNQHIVITNLARSDFLASFESGQFHDCTIRANGNLENSEPDFKVLNRNKKA